MVWTFFPLTFISTKNFDFSNPRNFNFVSGWNFDSIQLNICDSTTSSTTTSAVSIFYLVLLNCKLSAVSTQFSSKTCLIFWLWLSHLLLAVVSERLPGKMQTVSWLHRYEPKVYIHSKCVLIHASYMKKIWWSWVQLLYGWKMMQHESCFNDKIWKRPNQSRWMYELS